METYRNTERYNSRRVTNLSHAVREHKGSRDLDLDLFGYCPKCYKPYYVAEIKAVNEAEDYFTVAASIAKSFGAWCLAVREQVDEPSNFDEPVFKSVTLIDYGGSGKKTKLTNISYNGIIELKNEMYKAHVCDPSFKVPTQRF